MKSVKSVIWFIHSSLKRQH